MTTIEELNKQREELTAKAKTAVTEMEALTGDDAIAKQAEVDAHFSAIDAVDTQIDNAERLAKIEASNEERRETMHRRVENGGDAKFRAESNLPDPTPDDTPKVSLSERERRKELWGRYHRGEKLGESDLVTMRTKFPQEAWFSHYIREGDTQRVKDMRFAYVPDSTGSAALTPANPTTRGTNVDHLVPEIVFNEVIVKMKATGPLMEICRNITTDHGRNIKIPTYDPTGKKASIVAENTAPGTEAASFNKVESGVFRYAPKDIILSYDLLDDSAVDVEAQVVAMMGASFGRALEEHLMTGDGSDKPKGAYTVTAETAANLTTTGTASGAKPSLANFLSMFEGIDPAYESNLTLVVANDIYHTMRQFTTTGGDFLWTESLQRGAPGTFYGVPVRRSAELSSAAGKGAALVGDFNDYIYRVGRQMTVVRLLETYVSANGIGLHAEGRFGGVMADAESFRAIKIKA